MTLYDTINICRIPYENASSTGHRNLCAAFDTIDHALMLKHFETNMGISGCALQWLKSYLESRVYQVNIDGVLSETHKLNFGVPQGSVLGTLCFILYTSPVGKIIHKHGINFHFYADDTQNVHFM